MKKIILLISLSFFLSLSAKNIITQNWLNDKPRSYAKDFYIWRYLNQNISPNEAIWALGEVKNVNTKLFKRYARKLKNKETSRIVQCMNMKADKLIYQDINCIKNGLSIFKATKLSNNNIKKILIKLKTNYPDFKKTLEIISSKNSFDLLKNSKNKDFYNVFNHVGTKYRLKYFNHHFPKKLLQNLKKDKYSFASMIKKIVTNPKMYTAHKSLLNINSKKLSHNTIFFLAINAIRQDKPNIAMQYLKDAYKTAYFRFDKDKVLFWQYKLSKKINYLKELANSWDVNIYSMQAKEELSLEINNIKFSVDTINTKLKSNYNTSDPFSWIKILENIKKLDKNKIQQYKTLFNTKKTQGHISFIQERYKKYKIAYFVKPYDHLIKSYSLHRQALIYAIARQESRFIPSSISTSYALGVMQIMPFLSRALAKELRETYNIDDQLNASTNIRYANKHLNYLERKLDKNILFIAYAYNGGIGFTNRMLKSGLFKKGKYEPYLSIELVHYDESKRYAKKVLANYVIYYNELYPNNKLHLTTILKNIESPYL